MPDSVLSIEEALRNNSYDPKTVYLLAEGAGGACAADSVYVCQEGKTFVFFGKPQQLNESVGDTTLVESYEDLELVEREVAPGRTVKLPKDGRWIVEGVFQRSDIKNANGRVYPRSIWEKYIGDAKSPLQKTVNEGGMLGHLEHPKDGKTDGKDGALIVRKLELKEDGTVWGRAELLDTPNGMILQEYTRKGVRWGVSSRGNGTVKEDGTVSESDYRLTTFDGVMNPSTPGAYPQIVDDKKGDKLSGKKPVTESNDSDNTESPIIEAAMLLSNVSPANMTKTERAQFIKDCTSLLTTASTDTEETDEDTMLKTVAKIMGEKLLEAVTASETESIVEDTISDGMTSHDDDDYEAIAESVERERQLYEERLAELQGENASLRQQLESSQTDSTVQEDFDQFATRLTESEAVVTDLTEQVAQLTRELDVARGVIAEHSESDETDYIAEAVKDVIKETPELAEFRGILESAETPEAVRALSEKFAVTSAGRKPRRRKASARPTLPTANAHLLSESDATKASRGGRSANPPSKAASLAGAAVSKINERVTTD